MFWLWFALFAGQFETAFRAGVIALNNNNLPVARSQLETASKLQPENPGVWLALAQTYWKQQQPDSAAAAASRAESLNPDELITHGLAVFYAGASQPRKAEELLSGLVRRSPYREEYWFELTQSQLRRQDFAAALETVNAGRKNFDKSAQLELAAGVADYGLRRFPDAIDAFLRTVQLEPAAEQAYVFLGRMVDQAEGRLPRIVQAFAAFSARAPNNPMSSFLYGKALAAADDSGSAEALLKKSVAANDRFWESHFELGCLYERSGRLEDAAREIRRATELNANDAASHYRLARLYDRLGRHSEAAAERELHAKLVAAGQSMAGVK